jgi:cGMP-dependent protein kinase
LTQDKLADMKLQPPYIPPDDKVISDAEINKVAKLNIPIANEIEKSAGKFRAGKGPVPKSDWDKHF